MPTGAKAPNRMKHCASSISCVASENQMAPRFDALSTDPGPCGDARDTDHGLLAKVLRVIAARVFAPTGIAPSSKSNAGL